MSGSASQAVEGWFRTPVETEELQESVLEVISALTDAKSDRCSDCHALPSGEKCRHQLCAVCLVAMSVEEDVVRLSCSHIYHTQCAADLLGGKATECYVCKSETVMVLALSNTAKARHSMLGLPLTADDFAEQLPGLSYSQCSKRGSGQEQEQGIFNIGAESFANLQAVEALREFQRLYLRMYFGNAAALVDGNDDDEDEDDDDIEEGQPPAPPPQRPPPADLYRDVRVVGGRMVTSQVQQGSTAAAASISTLFDNPRPRTSALTRALARTAKESAPSSSNPGAPASNV